MTAVLLIGDVPSTGYVAGAAAERVQLGGEPPALPFSIYLELLEHRIAERRSVVVLYPSWHAGLTPRYTGSARMLLETDRVAAIGVDLPPLALSLLADQLTHLAPYVPAGVLASLATVLSHEVLAGAWLRSVTGLSHVDTKMGDHFRSYLTSSGFMVTAAPVPTLHSIARNRPVGPIAYLPTHPVQLLACQVDGDDTWFQEQFVPALRPSVVRMVDAQPLSGEFWGTKKYVEYVAFSGHPEALGRTINAMPTRTCHWCREPIGVPDCPFCHMSHDQAKRRERVSAYGTPVHATEERTGAAAGRSVPTGAPAALPGRGGAAGERPGQGGPGRPAGPRPTPGTQQPRRPGPALPPGRPGQPQTPAQPRRGLRRAPPGAPGQPPGAPNPISHDGPQPPASRPAPSRGPVRPSVPPGTPRPGGGRETGSAAGRHDGPPAAPPAHPTGQPAASQDPRNGAI